MSKPKEADISNKEPTSSSNDSQVTHTNPETKTSNRFTLPAWITTNITSTHALKVFFRCWLASWVAVVIMLPNASLQALGTSAFFAILSSFFLPPNMPVQLFLLMISTLVVGILMGWGIGAAAMRAADAVRSPALLQAASAQVQQSIASNPEYQANPSLAQTIAVFSGVFLDVRASVVYGCFLGFGAFVFGLVRAYAPKLVFLSIFGTIGIDIFCTLGPLFPTPRFTILSSFLKAVGCYAGIAVVVTICVFPETMSHSYLSAICQQLDRVCNIVNLQGDILRSSPSDLGASDSPIAVKSKGLRSLLIGNQKQLESLAGFVSLEFSWGRWSSDDVKDILEPMLGLVTRTAGFSTFLNLAERNAQNSARAEDLSPASTRTENSTSARGSNDAYLLRHIQQSNIAVEEQYNVRLVDILPLLEQSTAALRRACVEGVECTRKNLENINKHRWNRNASLDESLAKELDVRIEHLRRELTTFKTSDRMMLLEPFKPLLSDEILSSSEGRSLPLRNLFISYVFGSNLIAMSESTLTLMETVQRTMAKRGRNRLWAPKGLRKLGSFVRQRDGDDVAVTGEDTSPAETFKMQDLKDYKKDPDSAPPTNVFQRTMNGVHSFYQWTKTAEAMFVFKYAIISVLLWLPAVFRRSANFYYVQKGLWALIMAQTTMNIFASDQIFNLVTRLMGTVVGLVLGLVAWYMGSGHGNGNPYGIATAVGLWNIPVVFLRIYAPPQYLSGILLAAATYALIVGYSWVDGHLVSYGSPGIGWEVAWRRFVLVSIGSGASFIIMMLPPQSGRKAVRRRNASLIGGISSLYAFLMATWLSDDSSSKQRKGSDGGDLDPLKHGSPSPLWTKEFRNRLFGLAEEVNTIRGFTALAKWEGSIRGRWPSEDYHRLIEKQAEMIPPLAQLANALVHMDDEWRLKLLHRTGVLNPNFITEVISVFSMLSQSLQTGEPLHEVLHQRLVGRLFYHHQHHNHRHSTDVFVTTEQMVSLNYMYYATAVVAAFQLFQCLDELHEITQKICGTVPFEGFVKWRDMFERSRITV
ncbi:hypothetical protein PQX77_013510 [Marasmius sp. AFHP31]|nr:hypothetical protein PQX77_013510 [Marasmius sp. AFHP31]